MNEEILIKDNHLSEKEMSDLENFLISDKFPYYYNINIAGEDAENTDTFMFNHILIHKEGECSNVGNMITNMVMKNIPHKKIYRSKINFYLKTETLKKHIFHKDDVNDNINVALFYINTNNGYTEFEDGTIINSKRNRLVLFPCKLKHRSTTSTDTRERINININYD